jgi:uncharacterized damage-inducible protein DinB
MTTAMTIGTGLIPEFDQEMKTTRRLLERVPSDKGEWKPHPRSFSLGHLAQLVSWMPGWVTKAARGEDIDLAHSGGYSYEKTETLVDGFDNHVREAKQELSRVSDADLQKPWSLKLAGRVLFTLPRIAVIRQNINHLIHHRGQLTVYLRLLDVPIPSIYGPTADEKTF